MYGAISSRSGPGGVYTALRQERVCKESSGFAYRPAYTLIIS